MLLCAVIKKPAMQWIALLAVLLWIGLIVFEGVFRINQQRKRKSMRQAEASATTGASAGWTE